MTTEIPPRLPCAAMHGSEQCSSAGARAVKIAGNVFVTLCPGDDERLRAALAERDRRIAAATREADASPRASRDG